jgi:hypothetical protein
MHCNRENSEKLNTGQREKKTENLSSQSPNDVYRECVEKYCEIKSHLTRRNISRITLEEEDKESRDKYLEIMKRLKELPEIEKHDKYISLFYKCGMQLLQIDKNRHCLLCCKETNLMNSHIIPKSILKEIDSKFYDPSIKELVNPNNCTLRLFCTNCEGDFSKNGENDFARTFFSKKKGELHSLLEKIHSLAQHSTENTQERDEVVFEYDSWLFFLVVSIGFRIMLTDACSNNILVDVESRDLWCTFFKLRNFLLNYNNQRENHLEGVRVYFVMNREAMCERQKLDSNFQYFVDLKLGKQKEFRATLIHFGFQGINFLLFDENQSSILNSRDVGKLCEGPILHAVRQMMDTNLFPQTFCVSDLVLGNVFQESAFHQEVVSYSKNKIQINSNDSLIFSSFLNLTINSSDYFSKRYEEYISARNIVFRDNDLEKLKETRENDINTSLFHNSGFTDPTQRCTHVSLPKFLLWDGVQNTIVLKSKNVSLRFHHKISSSRITQVWLFHHSQLPNNPWIIIFCVEQSDSAVFGFEFQKIPEDIVYRACDNFSLPPVQWNACVGTLHETFDYKLILNSMYKYATYVLWKYKEDSKHNK